MTTFSVDVDGQPSASAPATDDHHHEHVSSVNGFEVRHIPTAELSVHIEHEDLGIYFSDMDTDTDPLLKGGGKERANTDAENAAAEADWERKHAKYHRVTKKWRQNAKLSRELMNAKGTAVKNDDDGNNRNDPLVATTKLGKSHRAAIFAHWIVNHFGLEYLACQSKMFTKLPNDHPFARFATHSLFLYPIHYDESCSTALSSCRPIIDVAGGRGELSFLLTAIYGLRCTVVDPRPVDVDTWAKQYETRREKGKNRLSKLPSLAVNRGLAPPADLSRIEQFCCNFPESLPADINQLPFKLQNKWVAEEAQKRAGNHLDSPTNHRMLQPVDQEVEKSPVLHRFHDFRNPMDAPSDRLLTSALFQRLHDTPLLMGMHTDGATEAIIDFGIRHKIPFAVIPCCVFPSFYPSRYLPNNVPVRKYEQFLDYLQLKHPAIQRDHLPITGRNAILYTNGYDT